MGRSFLLLKRRCTKRKMTNRTNNATRHSAAQHGGMNEGMSRGISPAWRPWANAWRAGAFPVARLTPPGFVFVEVRSIFPHSLLRWVWAVPKSQRTKSLLARPDLDNTGGGAGGGTSRLHESQGPIRVVSLKSFNRYMCDASCSILLLFLCTSIQYLSISPY